jgi:hypothetical protein
MGIIKQGILGGVSNKVGSVIGTSWKGIAVLRSFPQSVANPRTTPQVNQRTKFAAVVAFASAINSATIKPLWDRFAQRQSGNNAFVSRNIDNFNTSGVLATPATLEISRGKMAATPITSAIFDVSSGEILITFDATLEDNFQAATDVSYAVLYNATTDKLYTSTPNEFRSTGEVIVEGVGAIGNTMHAWLAFKRADGTVVSNTAYSAVTIQA